MEDLLTIAILLLTEEYRVSSVWCLSFKAGDISADLAPIAVKALNIARLIGHAQILLTMNYDPAIPNFYQKRIRALIMGMSHDEEIITVSFSAIKGYDDQVRIDVIVENKS
ncbi:hypothetical protein KKD19_03190 [Patescibacteria group bacterium]|nr:hypothetical protein [Patescibacteria group bacterium]MBU4512221.1 hypothetical protein [Patescibacteria group bacterium]MCG2692639.1 hypothetical protein [Candidatus Parcubacteria bacterium]